MIDPNFPDDVRDFHRACGEQDTTEPTLLPGRVPFDELIPALKALHVKLQLPSKSSGPLALRLRLIVEELTETVEALRNDDLLEAYDGILDLIYVVIGMGVSMGLPLNAGWDAVHQSNMAKVVGGAVILDGKIQKPIEWVPPTQRLAQLLDLRSYEAIPVSELPATSGYVQVLPPDDGVRLVNVTPYEDPPADEVDTEFVEAEPPQTLGGGLYGWRK